MTVNDPTESCGLVPLSFADSILVTTYWETLFYKENTIQSVVE